MEKNRFKEGRHFIYDLANALGVSFKAIESHSNVQVYQLIKPHRQDFLIAGELGCFEGGTTLARVRLFYDAKYEGEIIVSINQFDPKVIPHARRLFYEQEYPGVGFSYITGPHVQNKVQLLRRHAA